MLSSFRQPKQPINNNKKNDSDNSHQQQYVSLTHARQIPFGWGFNQISCANYFWEAMAWVCFSLLTRCWTSYLFAVLSIYQMRDWAVKKHQGYLKEFGKRYPKGRKAMFPFLL